jgi:hypothetical protein
LIDSGVHIKLAKENLHFQNSPREAHAKRREWVRERFPELSKYIDELWGAYGALGYEGVDGERARKATERVLNEIEARTGIKFS